MPLVKKTNLWTESLDTPMPQIPKTFMLQRTCRVLQDYPDAAALFKNVDVDHPEGGVFTAHVLRIYNALDMIINLLDDPEALDAALDYLADQHAARDGIKRAYFQVRLRFTLIFVAAAAAAGLLPFFAERRSLCEGSARGSLARHLCCHSPASGQTAKHSQDASIRRSRMSRPHCIADDRRIAKRLHDMKSAELSRANPNCIFIIYWSLVIAMSEIVELLSRIALRLLHLDEPINEKSIQCILIGRMMASSGAPI